MQITRPLCHLERLTVLQKLVDAEVPELLGEEDPRRDVEDDGQLPHVPATKNGKERHLWL